MGNLQMEFVSKINIIYIIIIKYVFWHNQSSFWAFILKFNLNFILFFILSSTVVVYQMVITYMMASKMQKCSAPHRDLRLHSGF